MVGISSCISSSYKDLFSSIVELEFTLSSSFEYMGYWALSHKEEEPNEGEYRTTLPITLVTTLCMFATKEKNKQKMR